MADKEKQVKPAKADAQKADSKKADSKTEKKDKKPNPFVKFFKGIGTFFKGLRSETKKIVWPDAKTVWKNTGVVLLVVAILGVVIYLIDLALTQGLGAIKQLAADQSATAFINSLFLM